MHLFLCYGLLSQEFMRLKYEKKQLHSSYTEMFTFPEVDNKSVMSCDIKSPLVPKITQKVYISYRVLGFQSLVNLAVNHMTKWLSSALVWQ